MRLVNGLLVLVVICAGCAGKVLQFGQPDDLKKIDDYDKKIAIKELPPEPAVPATTDGAKIAKNAGSSVEDGTESGTGKKKNLKKNKKKDHKIEKVSSEVLLKHLPDIEDSEGFSGRRPIVDPFRIGERIVLSIGYYNLVAGNLSIEVKPYVEVNGEKAYHFQAHALSNSFFSRIYGVDDWADTYVSYEKMIPFNLAITLKESKQLVEARTLFDWQEMKANYWKKRVTKEHGEEQSKVDWAIKPFSQNVISAAYYLRTFTFKVGKKLALRVVDEGKNIVFTGEVIRKEVLDTEIGKFRTVVIKPKIEVDGVFAPVGDILIWLTDDDRKFMVRAESKIKIGSLVARVREIHPGGDGSMPVQKPE